jgi:hypothetical protein
MCPSSLAFAASRTPVVNEDSKGNTYNLPSAFLGPLGRLEYFIQIPTDRCFPAMADQMNLFVVVLILDLTYILP